MPTSFPYTGLRLFTFPLLLLQSLQKCQKYYFAFFTLLLPLPPLSYYFATKHFAADTKFLGVVELTTQLLILENILWLPLCRINKFGLNTLSTLENCCDPLYLWVIKSRPAHTRVRLRD